MRTGLVWVPLAGASAVRLLADRVGLTTGLSVALTQGRFVPQHDRGRVLVDVATVLVAGGEAIADIDTLRHHDDLLGRVASPATVWRTLDEVTPAELKRMGAARANSLNPRAPALAVHIEVQQAPRCGPRPMALASHPRLWSWVKWVQGGGGLSRVWTTGPFTEIGWVCGRCLAQDLKPEPARGFHVLAGDGERGLLVLASMARTSCSCSSSGAPHRSLIDRVDVARGQGGW